MLPVPRRLDYSVKSSPRCRYH